MALPGVLQLGLRSLCNLTKFAHVGGLCTSNSSGGMRWNIMKSGLSTKTRASSTPFNQGGPVLLKEFPEPKSLLSNALSRSLGVSDLSRVIRYSCQEQAGLMRVTVTLAWPCKIEEVAFAREKIDAEQFAAAAACLKLRELGVIGPNNQLPPRRAGIGKEEAIHSLLHDDDFTCADDMPMPKIKSDEHHEFPPNPGGVADVSEALSVFPNPKFLLNQVIQLATNSNRFQDLAHFRTSGGKPKICNLTLLWPEKMTFKASGKNRQTAERRAAALACMKLKELNLLDKNNNPLRHAEYHHEEVKEAGKRARRPLQLDIPPFLEGRMKAHLTQFPVAMEVKRIEEKEEERAQQMLHQKDEDEHLVIDAITGRQHIPLSPQQAQEHNMHLLEEWENADPRLSTELPVDAHRQEVVSAVRSSRVVVIAGETGCGKTTRIPRFILEDYVRSGKGSECNILVTQPRRISAVSVSHRVSKEMGPALSHQVGYQVRLESRPPRHSGGALLFLTVGILLRKLQSNPTLTGISHVIVDEVHERDINTDLLLALLRPTLQQNPDLHVVLMSATGDNQRLAQYFGGCPIIKVPGFMHPVQDWYLEDVLRKMGRPPPVMTTTNTQGKEETTLDVDLVADVIEHIDRHGEPGAVLCFLPGWQEIKAVQERLEEKQRFMKGSKLILPLHSSLSVASQELVFQHPKPGCRKIVLATNIAETSITIDDIVHVVDLGTHKEQRYDPLTKVSCLDTVRISRSNVTQRKGRAGRCQPGQAYHLFPQKQLESMSPFPIPEIQRTPLESLVLQAKVHSPSCKAVDFLSQVLDSPEVEAVRNAVGSLQDIGVLDKTETLTPLGEHVACLSCDPRLGKVLVLGTIFRCVLPMLSVAACLTRAPFYNSLENRAAVRKVKKALSGSSHCDFLVFSRAVLGWNKVLQEGCREDRQEYLDNNRLSSSSLRFIRGLISQFSENLCQAALVPQASDCQRLSSFYNGHSHQDELLKAVLLAGLFPNLIQARKGFVIKGHFRPNSVAYRTDSGPVMLHSSSVNRGERQLPSQWMTFFSAVKSNGCVFIRDSSTVHPLALLLMTDSDIIERVNGDRVVVVFPEHSQMRCEMRAETWELLWDLRTSIQTMVYRHLNHHDEENKSFSQDGKLITLLIELLNNTDLSSHTQWREVD